MLYEFLCNKAIRGLNRLLPLPCAKTTSTGETGRKIQRPRQIDFGSRYSNLESLYVVHSTCPFRHFCTG